VEIQLAAVEKNGRKWNIILRRISEENKEKNIESEFCNMHNLESF